MNKPLVMEIRMTLAPRSVRPRSLALSVGVVIGATIACSTDPAATIQNPNLPVASGKAVSAEVIVSAATPDSATQDTTLDVAISGSGFIQSSTVNWALAGIQDPTQVRTNSVRYVSSRQLVANVTISSSATVAKWDIVVMAGSKGGIGTEAFAVKPHNPSSTWKIPVSAAGLGLRSDGAQSDGTYSVYDSGVCSVSSVIFTTGSGDGTLQTNSPTGKTRGCQGRTMSLVYPTGDPAYPNGGVETMLVFMNIHGISNFTTTIPIGYANRVERHLALNPTQKQRCDAWRWTSVSFPGDMVWVERINSTTYHVYTKDRDPDPSMAAQNAANNRAVCTTTGQVHHLSVDLFVISKEALP